MNRKWFKHLGQILSSHIDASKKRLRGYRRDIDDDIHGEMHRAYYQGEARLEYVLSSANFLHLKELDKRACVKTAYRLACCHGNVGVVQLLLELPNSQGLLQAQDYHEGFNQACSWGYSRVVEKLLNQPYPLADFQSAQQLFHCAAQGHLDLAKVLLEKTLEINPAVSYETGQAFMQACIGGHLAVVRYFFEHLPCLPKEYLVQGLINAGTASHLEVVKYLLKQDHLMKDPVVIDASSRLPMLSQLLETYQLHGRLELSLPKKEALRKNKL